MTHERESVKLVCHQLPGNYSVQCNPRNLQVFWIPPVDESRHFLRAVPTFRKVNDDNFISFADQLRLPSEVGREYNHLETFPNTEYEFGLNHITGEGVISLPDRSLLKYEACICKTPPDVPEAPEYFNCHYLQRQHYTCEWVAGNDHGSPIEQYRLQYRYLNAEGNSSSSDWSDLSIQKGNQQSMNFTLPTNRPTELRLTPVNSVGIGEGSIKVVRPPLIPIINSDHWKAEDILTYGGIGLLGIILFLIFSATLLYRRRREYPKWKHPFMINFNRSGYGNGQIRLVNGSLQDTSLAATKTTSMSVTGGVPMELSTFEPIWNQEINSLYGTAFSENNNEIYQSMLIPSSRIRFIRYIGCGAFGKVWEGSLRVTDESGKDQFERVALKVRNSKSLSEAEFKREAMLMRRYQHDNIVRFFGLSLDLPSQECLVLEMMEKGNLREYLHKSRPQLTLAQAEEISKQEYSNRQTQTASATLSDSTQESSLSNVKQGGIDLISLLEIPELIRIMQDIANGCSYLEEQHFVHRDIAARNCLVSHNHSNGRIVKLCDFGLARDVYKNDYYRKRNEPKLPVRWMSPEAILEGLFTSKSDVWAYAVTCWEVMTLGADPFFGQVNLDVISLVLGGNVLSKPENCPDILYNHFLQCWSRFPEMRPTFRDICKILEDFIEMTKEPTSPLSGPYVYRVRIGGSANQDQSTISTPTVNGCWLQSIKPLPTDSDVNLLETESISYAESFSPKQKDVTNIFGYQSNAASENRDLETSITRRQTSCPENSISSGQVVDLKNWSTTTKMSHNYGNMPPGVETGQMVVSNNGYIPQTGKKVYSRSTKLHRNLSSRPYLASTTGTSNTIKHTSSFTEPSSQKQYFTGPENNENPKIQYAHLLRPQVSSPNYYNQTLIQSPMQTTGPLVDRQKGDRHTDSHIINPRYNTLDNQGYQKLDSMGYERPLIAPNVFTIPAEDNQNFRFINDSNRGFDNSRINHLDRSLRYTIPARSFNETDSNQQRNYGIMHHSLYNNQPFSAPIGNMFQSTQFDFGNIH